MRKLFLLSAMALVMLASCEKNNPTVSVTVTDSCGNTYKGVTIGTQTWMAENLKCNKYDTESEAYKAGTQTIPTSASAEFAPYYTDATDQSKWESTEKSGNLSSEQIAKLGYLYSWAAAVGVADGGSQTTDFTGNRQGICPNGWHVPTKAEWETLANYIDGNNGQTDAGKKLKTTSGWYDGDTEYTAGTDSYGFAALPAGSAAEGSVVFVGSDATFWTATTYESGSVFAYGRNLIYSYDRLTNDFSGKASCLGVRCVKN